MRMFISRSHLNVQKVVSPLVLLLFVTACSYPSVQASTVDARPHLSVANAPAGAVLTVDGVAVGLAADYAPDKKLLTLDHGTHHVVVSNGAQVIFDNSVYLGDGTDRVISLPQ